MSVVAVVPVKHLAQAKSRLEGAVPDRPGLALILLGRVLRALQESEALERILVISPDPRVEEACRGARFLRQKSRGLNPALEEARQEALALGASALLVVLADLATLSARTVRRILTAAPAVRGALLAPDRLGQGTNALFLRPPDLLAFRFGSGSLQHHQEEAARAGIPLELFWEAETMNDVDTPEHLLETDLS